jgi:hypothetical protein
MALYAPCVLVLVSVTKTLFLCMVWQVEDILISINGLDLRNVSGVLSFFYFLFY